MHEHAEPRSVRVSGDDMLMLRDSRVWWTKFEHDPDCECGDRGTDTSMTLSLRFGALDSNADQGVIKQANFIATPEEAFSLRQLLIAAANRAPFLADA